MARNRETPLLSFCFVLCFSLFLLSSAFQSDELQDDEEFGLQGGRAPNLDYVNPQRSPSIRKRSSSDQDSDSKVQFLLEHAFGSSDFSPAGTFTARLKTWSHGGQTLTKLRFSRSGFSEAENEEFKKLLENDDFYRIRVPSNVMSPPGRAYIISAVKARCLPRETLDEQFVLHMEGVNILAVNYGSPGACQYPRPLKLPAKWSFNSHTVLKNSEQAPRVPAFAEEILVGDDVEGEGIKPPEKTFWAKYWMYLIPLGLIVMNAVTQAMNLPEEPASGQASSQATAQQRAPSSAVRRR